MLRSSSRPLPQVTVVGASAAGLDLATQAAERGLEVTVYERSRVLAGPERTLIVTPRVREFLGSLLDDITVNTIRRYELFADGCCSEVTLSEPDLVIERSSLITRLAERARDAGVGIELGHRFLDLAPGPDGIHVRLDGNSHGEQRHVAEAVIGADGASSGVARAAGWPQVPTVPLVQAVVSLPDDLAPDTTRVWFRPQESPYFYWLIPESPQRAVLGLIGDEPHTARCRLDGFLAQNRLVPLEYQAARVPAYSRWVRPHRKLKGGDVFLVGDAAGHVKVSTVGGIHTGFRGARAVVDMLVGDSQRGLRGLRKELNRHLLIRRALHRFGEDDYRRLLALLGPRTSKVLARHTRDHADQLLWRLCLREPRLALLTMRGILARGSPSVLPEASPDDQRVDRSLTPQF